jgi:hypothetical protein
MTITGRCFITMFLLLFVWKATEARTIVPTDTSDSTNTLRLKSSGTGRLISAAGTLGVVGIGILMNSRTSNFLPGGYVIASGIIVGPSFGYFYGNETGRGLGGIAVRAGIMGGSMIIGIIAGSTQRNGWDGLGTAVVISGIGAVITCIAALEDINHVGELIDENNTKIRKASLSLETAYFPQTSSYGLNLRMNL